MSGKKNTSIGKELKGFGKEFVKEGKGWIDTALGNSKSKGKSNKGGGKCK